LEQTNTPMSNDAPSLIDGYMREIELCNRHNDDLLALRAVLSASFPVL
jgi:hypothetical protein